MKQKFKRIIISVITLIIILLGIILFPKLQEYFYRQKLDIQNKKTIEEVTKNLSSSPKTKPDIQNFKLDSLTIPKIPETAYLKVPFICQAPLQTKANWKFHEESCEEAALLQAYLYETGKTISKEEANSAILQMIDWQKDNFGSHHDLYAQDMKKFIIGYYKLKDSEIKIIENASIEDIKKEISFGHPVIVPITGDILNNPYYPYPGYHMLTVIGYTKNRIITNDNGTRRGADFSYDTDIFEKAMKDAGADIIILRLNNN